MSQTDPTPVKRSKKDGTAWAGAAHVAKTVPFAQKALHAVRFPSGINIGLQFLMIHDKLHIAFGDESFMFLTYQLSMVGYWPTMAVTGTTESVSESEEGARETATISKEGSRRVNYPILTQCDKKEQYRAPVCHLNKACLSRCG